ncbi:isopeptide-forming domain-containing fimbrial protein [Aphanizomenon flos-aquae NRERC-008]|nr:isopeptide-forming domain-containing fimbrial protein [Aphanizomenon flos-aquae NRERC-008]
MVSGQWSVVSGQWSVVSGQWSVVINNEQRTTNNEQRTTNNGQRTTKLMLKKTKRPPGNYTKKLITSLAFMICVWGQSLQPVSAEGSRDLVKNFGYRPYTEWLPGVSIADIPRKTLLKVYVQAGETINLGSSVHTSFGGGTQDIVYRDPSGTTGSCDVRSDTGFGFINTFAKESNGPFPLAGGYTPCTITAPAAGVYEVEFHGPSETSTANPPVRAYNVQFPTDGTQEATVAAWDITVTSGGVEQPGRVFTSYLSLNMGGNSTIALPQLGLNSILFVQTKDGYRYQVILDRLDPGNFIFFGNNRGFIDNFDNSNLYRSITAPTEDLNFNGNVGLHLPTLADTPTNVTHRVFFNRPDSVTLGGLGIPLTAILPQAPADFKFTGIAGNTTKVNQGGIFTFTTNQFGRYQIVIDTNQDNIYGNSNDRILTGGIVSGLNTVNWNGRDQADTALPVGIYNAKIYVTAGEYHFPLLDAESNQNGLRIIMENAPGAFNNTAKDYDGADIDNSTVYYDDSNYTTKNGTPVNLDRRNTNEIASDPRNALQGRSSSAFGRHQWSNLYGNLRGMDTWIYFLDPAGTATPIVIVAALPNITGTKKVEFKTDADGSGSVTIGDKMEYTITYTNTGDGDANNFVIKDTLPTQLTYVPNLPDSLSIVSQTPGNTLGINGSYNGTTDVNLISPGTLRAGDTITIRLQATVNAVAANISNQAKADFTPANTSSVVTTLTDAVSTAGSVTNPTTGGQIVTQIANNGIETGNDPSKTEDDDPTLFTSVNNPPKLLLVKRITALNGDSTNFNVFDPLDATNQVSSNWPSGNTTYLRGKINGGQVEPGDILEYTIYFLSAGGVPAANTKICDLVPDGLEFVPTGFNTDISIPPNTGSDFGIVLGWNSTNIGSLPSPATPLNGASLLRLTGVGDADGGEFFAAGATPSTTCTATNTNGAVVVVVGGTTAATGIPKATAPGTPTGAYGFFRFRAKVK